MIRQLSILTLVTVLAGGVQPGHAQPRSSPSASQEALDEASRLNKLVEKLYSEGKFGEPVPLAERALDIREKALGPMHPLVAQSLNSLAVLYKNQGAYAKAEPLYVRALDIREKALGPMHPDTATSLNNLAVLYIIRGAYEKAEPLYVRALDIREKALGPMHPDTATSLNNLAVLYKTRGAYEKAEPLHVRALDIREKALGPMHPDVAESLTTLAGLYYAQGLYEKVEPLAIRALDITEKALGPMHPDVAQSLTSLAVLYHAQGAYEKAEPLHVRALDIREKALGPMHLWVALSLDKLAELYRNQGAYGKAEPLFLRALDIEEKTLGAMHPNVATILDDFATLYKEQGAYRKAEPLYARALNIREMAHGSMHPDVALSLNNLAIIFQRQGVYDKAESLLVRALNISEKTLGAMHPNVTLYLNNLARLYHEQGAYRKTEPLLVRALDITERALGPMHQNVATHLGNLASLHLAQGAYDKAEPLYVRALDITEQVLGPAHPKVARSLNDLAGLHWARGAYGKAERLMSRAAEIVEVELRDQLARLSEARKRALMARLQGETDRLVSLQADVVPSGAPALELALTTILRRKGRVLDSLVDHETTLRGHLTPQLRDQLDQLIHARAEIVARLYAPSGPRNTTDRAAIVTARARIDDLESTLSAVSAEFRAQSELVTVARIQAALPRDAVLVELVRYRRFDPRQAQKPWHEEHYVAYLVRPHGPPQWVTLGEAARIDIQVDAVLAAMAGKVPTKTAKAALRHLDALVFAPIRARLAGVSHVILAPDSKLNLVPFEALLDPQGHYALENYLVSYVTTGRDLLRFAAPYKPRSSSAILVGPDYGPPPSTLGTMSFTPLAGALGEAADLQNYFPNPPLIGEKATKSALAALIGPAMLHVATHGFYARDSGTRPTAAPAGPSRGMFVAESTSSLLPPPRSEDPADALDRAGLAMAGANQGVTGIVTAREIAGFDWWGTQLVVLSACETGVGAVPSGDGVYGLRRALVLAGTASQVVSLWNVNDSSARELMRAYYGELARGTGRAEALRQAKLRMMSQPRQPRYAHPYYWAAFIPAGDWRPLDKNVFSLQKPRP